MAELTRHQRARASLVAAAAIVFGPQLQAQQTRSVPAPAVGVAAPEPVRVGIIDSNVDGIKGGMRNLTLEQRSFLPPGERAADAFTAVLQRHGTLIASSFAQQARGIDRDRPIEIYASNAFVRLPTLQKDDEGHEIERRAIDFPAANRALDWFKEKGVRVVVTAFIGRDSADMQNLMAHAKELGIVVFAATNNDPARFMPFPARHPDAVAVTGNNENLDFRWNRSMDAFVKFKTDGSIPPGYKREQVENGSSYAAAKVAAFGAFVAAADPTVTREAMVAAIAGNEKREDGIVDASVYGFERHFLARLPQVGGARVVVAMPEPSRNVPVAVATAPAPRPTAAMAALAAGAMMR